MIGPEGPRPCRVRRLGRAGRQAEDMRRSLLVLCLGVLVAWVPVASSQSTSEDRATRAIRRELLLLPRYGVFDHLAFKYDRGTVTLLGQVRIGQLKSDAEAAAKSVEGV